MPDPKKRTKNSLGKEKVGDKLGKNKPKRLAREGVSMTAPSKTGMRGTMSKKSVYRYTS